MPPTRKKRCPNGTRFNQTSRNCDPFNKKGLPCEYTGNRKRCQRSTRCNTKTGKCDTTNHALRMKRCPTGHRRNKVTKNCDKQSPVQRDNDEEEENGEASSRSSDDSFTRLLEENPVPDGFSPTRQSESHSRSPSHEVQEHQSEVKELALALDKLASSRSSSSRRKIKPPSIKEVARELDARALGVRSSSANKSPSAEAMALARSSSSRRKTPTNESPSVEAMALAFDKLAVKSRSSSPARDKTPDQHEVKELALALDKLASSRSSSSKTPAGKSPSMKEVARALDARALGVRSSSSSRRSSANKSPSAEAMALARSSSSRRKTPTNESPSVEAMALAFDKLAVKSRSSSSRRKTPSSSETKKANKTSFISRRTQKQRELYERNQLKKIKKLIRNKDLVKQKSKFLNSICSDSGVCVAFGGRSAKIIKHFFKDFTGFDYLDSISPIGEKSANGFLYSLKYLRESYMAHAILKSSRREDADNLMYEYGVGLEINKLFYDKYPIFVETYKCYRYESEEAWKTFGNPSLVPYLMSLIPRLEYSVEQWTRFIRDGGGGDMEDSKKKLEAAKKALEKTRSDIDESKKLSLELPPPSAKILKDSLIPYKEIDYERSCTETKHICLLVQHIDKAPTLNQEFGTMKISEVLNVLYQVYFTLSAISSTYTHYDLHASNVLLYTPVRNKFIQYHYHTKEGDVISFKSSFIVKIIDYGRSFVKPFSEEAEKEVCDTDECAPDCGSKFGYYFNDRLKKYSIRSSRKNESHDLRLLHFLGLLISDEHKRNGHVSDSHSWLHRYLFLKANYMSEFGTPEKLETGLITHRGGSRTVKINNVTDASTLLQKLLLQRKEENERTHSTQTKLGDLHVYCDGRNMEYEDA
jgi:hypothetical protein